jgi:hypothetical protein
MRLRYRLSLVVIVAGLAGMLVWTMYVLLRSPQDLQVVSLDIATVKDLPAGDYPGASAQPDVLVAVVRFKTRTDLRAFARGDFYKQLYLRVKLCRDQTIFASGNNLVYDAAGPLGFDPRSNVHPGAREYHLYFRLRPWDRPTVDLVSKPEDVCLTLIPDAMEFGFGPSTNTMRISASDLNKVMTHSRVN